MRIGAADREPQPDFQAGVAARADSGQRRSVGAGAATERIVRRRGAVEADARVLEPAALEPLRQRGVEQGAVRVQDGAQAAYPLGPAGTRRRPGPSERRNR